MIESTSPASGGSGEAQFPTFRRLVTNVVFVVLPNRKSVNWDPWLTRWSEPTVGRRGSKLDPAVLLSLKDSSWTYYMIIIETNTWKNKGKGGWKTAWILGWMYFGVVLMFFFYGIIAIWRTRFGNFVASEVTTWKFGVVVKDLLGNLLGKDQPKINRPYFGPNLTWVCHPRFA